MSTINSIPETDPAKYSVQRPALEKQPEYLITFTTDTIHGVYFDYMSNHCN